MRQRMTAILFLVLLGCQPMPAAGPVFEVTLDPKAAPAPVSGRLIVGIQKGTQPPRFTSAMPPTATMLAIDVDKLAPGKTVRVDSTALQFPEGSLARLPAERVTVQAVLMHNRDQWLPHAEGNFYSVPGSQVLDLATSPVVRLTLSQTFGSRQPADTATRKFHSLPSKLLSDFHGRPMVYRVGVVLPPQFDAEPDKKYALIVHIGGFGESYRSALRIEPDPRFVQIMLDGTGPFGDPYQINSANNGPYGDALTQEVIPWIETRYRCLGTPKSRFTCGVSTGGWVSLALQVFYPDFFNGCWSQCPDPVDFRCLQLVDIYRDANAYTNRFGIDHPACRTREGVGIFTIRHECQLERVLGRGERWELGGQQWASWNAVFSPRGSDGMPVPVWDAQGKIDGKVSKQWEKYDLRRILEQNWKTLGPKLAGDKIHIWVGDADDFFLNNAVWRLKEMLESQESSKFEGQILIEPRKGHGRGGWTSSQMRNAMAVRAELTS